MPTALHLATWTSTALCAAAVCGVVLLVAQLITLRVHLGGRWPGLPRRRPAISILKPLCGLDDDLEENLRSFAALPYPVYEVLLGVRSERDPAYELARAVARRWP